MSRYEVYQKRDNREDSTPISPQSPKVSSSASPKLTTGQKAALAYGAYVGRQAHQLGIGELEARGNEELAKSIENTTRFLAYGGLVAKMGVKALIPIAISEGSQAISQTMERGRENQATEIKRNLLGQKQKIGGSND